MKKIILLVLLGITCSVHAQTKDKIIVTLKEAMDLGVKNRYDMQADQYNIDIAQNDILKSRKAWIPDVKAQGQIQYNTQLQSTLVPGGFLGSSKPQLITMGAKNASIFGLSLKQPVFEPGINSNIKLAKNQQALAQEKNRQSEIRVKIQIATAYFNVLLKRLQRKIASNEEKRYREYMELAQGKYQQGALIENDYLRAQLNHENAKVEEQTVTQDYNLSIDKLKNEINVPAETQLVLADSLNNLNSMGQNAADAFSRAENRTEIKQLKIEQLGNKLTLEKMHRNALPTLSFVANYSEQFLYDDFSYFKNQWWKPFSYVGLQLSIPITSHLKNKNNIREERLKIDQTNLELKQTQSDIHFEIQKALTDLDNAQQNVQSTKSNYNLSQTIYKNQQRQFALGAFQFSDLLDTEKSLHTAEQNYVQAVYNYLVAKINYEKAIGAL
jgi:outer membrane protein